MSRRGGVLMPISSLPGSLGIGDFGNTAYEWVDKMAATKADLWQILPLNPVGYGNSPYQTYSSFAGDLIYVSVEAVYRDMDLDAVFAQVEGHRVDYEAVRKRKETLLHEAFHHFRPDARYGAFLAEAYWLEDYTEFMALRRMNRYRSWTQWDVFEADPEMKDFEAFVQYYFYRQWMDLKAYANDRGIEIVGDIPIYVGHDSADVYAHREGFLLNPDGSPSKVAGVPPDFFNDEGQLWGNPIYDWEQMQTNNYRFWADRLRWNQKLFDIIRIDHFRAFDTYWVIDAQSTTARHGQWQIGPRHDFFDAMFAQIPDLNLVVEDLGDLRPEVLELRDDYHLMGMKIIQFALNPHEFVENDTLDRHLLVYTGTHDNQTLQGYLNDLDPYRIKQIEQDLDRRGYHDDHLVDRINHYCLGLNADWAILPVHDLLRLDDRAKLNSPGTIGSPNWEWKLLDWQGMDEALKRFTLQLQQTQRTS